MGRSAIDVNLPNARHGAVLAGGDHRFSDLVASALGWWAEAGVDTPISETPVDWLAPPPPAPRIAAPTPVAALPNDLAAFHALLAEGDYVPGAPPARRRVAPAGDPTSPLMIVADMPDEADLRAGHLFSAEAALFDAMLAAMGLTRDTIYLAPLSPARITGGRLGPAAAPLARLMRAHLGLVRPKAVLVFGDEAGRALFGDDRRPVLRELNHDGGIVAAVATIHPRILRRTPACKAEAWTAMRHLLGVLAR